ncbi:hypothetical protein G9A89_017291 [Geosiphon pyriformis]|nr:hypothetical protein G9A89_017291 [Geosiphon pyriformis]
MTFKEIFDSLQPISCSAEEACILGFFYQFGLGTTRSYEASFNWYQVAVEKGEPFALIQLGECYERSRGCQEDKSKTVKYYQKSAELGHPQAFYKLVEYQKKRQHQLIWLQKSTVNGFKPAIATMAALLLCGNGVLKDKHEAIKIVFKYAPGEDKVDFRRKVLEYCFNSFP